jgi:choline dehydrogenase-like flavoprotein
VLETQRKFSPILIWISLTVFRILSQFGIETKVNLPTVGENLQDQMNNGLGFKNNETFKGQSDYVAYPSYADVVGEEQFNVSAANIKASIPSYAATVAAASNNVTKASDLEAMFNLQWSLIFESRVPIAEILITPSSKSFSVQYWALLPFSRGNIHISSANTSALPAINPNYFMLPWDSEEQINTARYIREILATAPLSDLVTGETSPGLEEIPANATDAEWQVWINAKCKFLSP